MRLRSITLRLDQHAIQSLTPQLCALTVCNNVCALQTETLSSERRLVCVTCVNADSEDLPPTSSTHACMHFSGDRLIMAHHVATVAEDSEWV